MKHQAIPASWPLRRALLASGILLALSSLPLTSTLNAAPPSATDPWELAFGRIGVKEEIYRLHSAPGGRSSNAFTFDGDAVVPLDPLYALQFDASYSRLSPGGGLPGSNEYSLDTHIAYKIDDIPVGAFVGWDKNGASTFGGGVEGSLPLGKWNLLPKDLSPAGDPLVNWQAFYARTPTPHLNHFGGTLEARVYPCENSRVSLHACYHHTVSKFGSLEFRDNIFSFGVSAGYLFPCGWMLDGGYEHTHFNTSGLGVEGFTLGLHYCFGKKTKIRDIETPYLDFSRMLGVQAKF